MPLDFPRLLLRRGVNRMSDDRMSCARCRRTPLPGELVHVFEGERRLCALCRCHETRSEPLRAERVPASERRVPLVTSAA